jgi:hypothetical protein
MPDKSPRPPGEADGAGKEETDFSKIERGIDAVNALRLDMRKAGMTACADALDQAFAHCLREFLALKGGPADNADADPQQ